MTDNNKNIDRDEVLYAFHDACERPTVDDICRWIEKYPQFADDIRTHAAIARDLDARKNESLAEAPDKALLDRAYSNALNVFYSAKLRLSETDSSEDQTFQKILAANGKNVPSLAREIDISRSILADLVNGVIQAPVGRRFQMAVMNALSISEKIFDSAFTLARDSPRMGYAKSSVTPTVKTCSYEETIRAADMSEERIRYWLDED